MMIEPNSSRMIRTSSVSDDFLDQVRQAFVTRSLSSSIGTLTTREKEAALVCALAKMVQRAAQRDGVCIGATDLIHDLHGQDVLLMRLTGGVLVGLAMDYSSVSETRDDGRDMASHADLRHAFDLFVAGRHARPGLYR